MCARESVSSRSTIHRRTKCAALRNDIHASTLLTPSRAHTRIYISNERRRGPAARSPRITDASDALAAVPVDPRSGLRRAVHRGANKQKHAVARRGAVVYSHRSRRRSEGISARQSTKARTRPTDRPASGVPTHRVAHVSSIARARLLVRQGARLRLHRRESVVTRGS